LKHATDRALDRLEDLLNEVRKFDKLTEKTRGVFYLKAVAFLHFHEDPAGLFADLKQGGEFQRYSVNSASEQKTLLSKINDAIEELSATKK